MVDEKPLILDDYVKTVMQPMFKRCAENEIRFHEEFKKQAEFWGLKPATRYDRFKAFWRDKGQRCKDICTIITGGDIHKNCGQ